MADWSRLMRWCIAVPAMTLLTGCAPSITSDDIGERREAVANITDQSLLMRVALEDESAAVRMAAMEKVTDQSLLARMAIDDKSESVRKAAVEKVTDQALLEKVAREHSTANLFGEVRLAAVERLTDQAALARMATMPIRDLYPPERGKRINQAAIARLTDQTLLAKVVEEKDADEDVRIVAVSKLTDQTLLMRIARDGSGRSVRLTALGNLRNRSLLAFDAQTPMLQDLEPIPADWCRNRKLEAGHSKEIASLRLFLTDPAIESRLGQTTMTVRWHPMEQKYVQVGGPGSFYINGDAITVRVAGDKMKEPKVLGWATEFPQYSGKEDVFKTKSGEWRFLKAEVNLASLIAPLVPDLPADEFAAMRLQYSDPEGCLDAIRGVTDQSLLARAVLKNIDFNVSMAAIEKLNDQSLLAKVAAECKDNDDIVRAAAVRKLKDQKLLAKFAVESQGARTRKAAVQGLTDRTVLATVAAADNDPDVRDSAQKRLESTSARD